MQSYKTLDDFLPEFCLPPVRWASGISGGSWSREPWRSALLALVEERGQLAQ